MLAHRLGKGLRAVIVTALLLVVEVIITLLVYTGLNLYSFDLFGRLVRAARTVLEILTAAIETWGPANAAYATLLGELGPKSILLLLIGLVVAAAVRLTARLAETLVDADGDRFT